MTVNRVDGAGAPGGAGGSGGIGGAGNLFGDLLNSSMEELKKKQEQGLVGGAGISLVSLDQLGAASQSDDPVKLASGGGSATEQAQKLLHEMTSEGLAGYWKWYIKQLRDKVKGDVMEGMGITEQSLNAMPPAQKAATEKAIDEIVEKKVKELIEKEIKRMADTDPKSERARQMLIEALTG